MNTTLERETTGPVVRDEFVAPDVNIFETQDGYVLQAEMPGVNKSGLAITVEGTEITHRGRPQPEGALGEPLFRERSRAAFKRVFELDPAIDTARISGKIRSRSIDCDPAEIGTGKAP